MSQAALDRLVEAYPEAILSTHTQHGDETALVKASSWAQLATFLRDDPSTRFEMLTDLTVVDQQGRKQPRFEVVAHFYSLSLNHRLRLKAGIPEDPCEIDSLVPVFKSAYWMEREAFDLYGVIFKNHPDLRRLLLYPEFEGHPLRKDYDIEHRQPRIDPRPGHSLL